MRTMRLMTLAPGHFHAALVLKFPTPGVHARHYIYAPLDADLVAHLDRIASFNTRGDEPTKWEIDVRAGADFLDRFVREQPGNTVVLSGRNRSKIDLMRLAVANNLHVLADKPWIVEAADFPKLEDVVRDADRREVLLWDMLTERHEVTNRLQRELVGDRELFGDWLAGSPANPGLVLDSVHYLKKTVAGMPLRRPWWWFDAAISGDAMADVGTHLADLALWLAFPDQAIDHAKDVQILNADRWPMILDRSQFAVLTGLPDWHPELLPLTVEGQLDYAGNNSVTFAVRGLTVRLTTQWEYESPGGDIHTSLARGERATVSVRQQPGGMPDLFVTATKSRGHVELMHLMREKCDRWQQHFPGLAVEDRATEARLIVPDALRTGHEAHFVEVVAEFVRYFQSPRAVPEWERTNALTRYFITTHAVELARKNRPASA
jgi:predicted dehydrogenase